MTDTTTNQRVVRLITSRLAEATQGAGPGGIDNGGGGSDDGGMETRLTALETRFDATLPTLATKADLGELRGDVQKVSADISRWMLATMLTIIGAMLAAIFGVSQVYKSATAPPQVAPIIINVPPTTTAVPAPAAAKPAK